MTWRILLVDDEVDFLEILSEFMEDEGYGVVTATNGRDALRILGNETFDLLLSDINMPEMKGFELLERASGLYPQMKRALITAYDVSDYLYLARNHNVGNIFTKTTPFNFEEISVLLRDILTADVFGLERHVHGEVKTATIYKADDIETMNRRVIESIDDPELKRRFRQALGEVVINAYFYGGKDERGDQKQKWEFGGELEPGREIVIAWGSDEEKVGISVTDFKGRLTKQSVLYWLERNTARKRDGTALGLTDTHGKGLYITRKIVDRLIINIEREKRTEVVLLNYKEGLYTGHRPLWIHEV